MKRKSRLSRWLAFGLALTILLNTQGFISLADTIVGTVTDWEETEDEPAADESKETGTDDGAEDKAGESNSIQTGSTDEAETEDPAQTESESETEATYPAETESGIGNGVGSETEIPLGFETEDESESETEEQTEQEQEFLFSDDSVSIKAYVSPEAGIPEDAVLLAQKLEEGSAEYEAAMEAARESVELAENETLEFIPYDVFFLDGEDRIEPTEGAVRVEMTFTGTVFASGSQAAGERSDGLKGQKQIVDGEIDAPKGQTADAEADAKEKPDAQKYTENPAFALHIKDSGEVEQMENLSGSEEQLVFDVTSFSVMGPARVISSLSGEELKGTGAPIYAILYENGELVFQNDDTEELTGTRTAVVKKYTGVEKLSGEYTEEDVPWHGERASVSVITFRDPIQPKTMRYWFADMTNEEKGISFINVRNTPSANLDTSLVTDMSYAFQNSTVNFNNIVLNNWDMSQVTDVSRMFQGSVLTGNLMATNWDLSQVTDLSYMFQGCQVSTVSVNNWQVGSVTDASYMFQGSTISSLSADNWVLGSVTDVSHMFEGCTNLSSMSAAKWGLGSVTDMSCMFKGSRIGNLNVPDWNLDSVITMACAFQDCTNLSALTARNWGLKSVTDMTYAFQNCTGLSYLYADNWTLEELTDMSYAFQNCSRLSDLDATSWNLNKVTDMSHAFQGGNFYTLKASGWDLSSVEDMSYAFESSRIYNLDVSDWHLNNVTNMTCAFQSCTNLRTLTADNWGLGSAEDMSYAFQNCMNLRILTANGWTMESLTDMSYAFQNCTCLQELHAKNWNLGSVTTMSHAFENCGKIAGYASKELFKDTGNWDLSQVEDLSYAFSGCSYIQTLNVSGWGLGSVTDMSHAFDGCSALQSLSAENWDLSCAENMSYAFHNCSNLSTLKAERWVLDRVTDMSYAFYGCGRLATFGVDVWGLGNAENLSYAFYNCSGLKSLNAGGWDLSQVKDLSYAFSGCTALQAITVDKWDLGRVTTLSNIFYNCRSLTSLNASGWSLRSVEDLSNAFYNCYSLKTLNADNWDLSHVTSMSQAFYECRALETLTGGWNLNSVTDLNKAFYNCQKLTALDVSNWDLSAAENLSYLFYNCSALTELETGRWNLRSAKDINHMFSNCTKLNDLDTRNWDMENAEDLSYAFSGCNAIKSFDIGSWNLDQATNLCGIFYNCYNLASVNTGELTFDHTVNLSNMFYSCGKLTTLDAGRWTLDSAEDLSGMFHGCSGLKSLEVNGWSLRSAINLNSMFYGCSGLTKLDTGDWDLGCAEKMEDMFRSCTNLVSLDAKNWDMNSVQTMKNTFNGCANLYGLDTSGWTLRSVADMSFAFNDCSDLASLDTDTWVLDNVTNMNSTFAGCVGLTEFDMSEWKPDKLQDMTSMFSGCTRLACVDTGDLSLASVTTMKSTFLNCSSLKEITSDKWTLDSVTSMSETFRNCTSLKAVDVNTWGLENITSMNSAFQGCTSLTEFDMSEWTPQTNAGKTWSMTSMFSGCTKLARVDTDALPLSNVSSMSSLFCDCHSLKDLETGNWVLSSVTSIQDAFANCTALEKLDSIGWDLGKLTDMGGAFSGCTALAKLDTSQWKHASSGISNMNSAFMNCSSLKKLKFTNWKVNNSGSYYPMVSTFSGCTGLEKLDLAGLQVRGSMNKAFDGCTGLHTLKADGWTLEGSELIQTFHDCSALKELDSADWKMTNVKTMFETFLGCHSLASLETGKWNMDSVTNLTRTFADCRSLTELHTGRWNMSKVQTLEGAFSDCRKLTTLETGNWNTESLTNMNTAFSGCRALETLDLSSWNTSKVTGMSTTFGGMESLKTLKLGENFAFYGTSALLPGPRWKYMGSDGKSYTPSQLYHDYKGAEMAGTYVRVSNDEAAVVTVTLTLDGGEAKDPATGKETEEALVYKVFAGNPIGELPVPKKTDCEFLGWKKDGDVSEPVTYMDKNSVFDRDTTLVAQWLVKDCTVSFDPCGGTWSGEQKNNVNEETGRMKIKVAKGHTLSVLPGCKKEVQEEIGGETHTRTYFLEGWYTGREGAGIQLTKDVEIEDDAVYYAHWTEVYAEKKTENFTFHYGAEWTNESNTSVDNFGGVLVFHPTSNYSGYSTTAQMHVYFQMSEVKEGVILPEESIEIRIPRYVFEKADGTRIGELTGVQGTGGLPKYSGKMNGVYFNYELAGDYCILRNTDQVTAATGVNVNVSYSIRNNEFQNIKGGAQDANSNYLSLDEYPFYQKDVPVTFTVYPNGKGKGEETEEERNAKTEVQTPLSVEVHTKASTTQSKSKYSVLGEWNWETAWGSKPEDADQYYYVKWRLYESTSGDSTQKFTYRWSEDTVHDGELVYLDNSYAVTRHPVELWTEGSGKMNEQGEVSLYNEAIVTETWDSGYETEHRVSAVGKVKAPTPPAETKKDPKEHGDNGIVKTSFSKSNGNNNYFISGGQDKILVEEQEQNINWQLNYTGGSQVAPTWNDETQTYNVPERKVILRDGLSGDERYSSGNEKQPTAWEAMFEELTDEDYRFKTMTISLTEYDAVFNEFEKWDNSSTKRLDEIRGVDVWVRYQDQDEFEYFKTFTVANTSKTIALPNGVVGVELRHTSMFYKTVIAVTLTMALKPTEHVKAWLQKDLDDKKPSYFKNRANCRTWIGKDEENEPDVDMDGSSYWYLTHTEPAKNKLTQRTSKSVSSASLNYELSTQDVSVMLYGYVSGSVRPKYVTSGLFYDLIPGGINLNEKQIKCYLMQGNSPQKTNIELDPARYNIRFEKDWQGSGMTMMIIDFTIPESAAATGLCVSYKLRNTLENIKRGGQEMYTDVAFVNTTETGKEEPELPTEFYWNRSELKEEAGYYESLEKEYEDKKDVSITYARAKISYIPITASTWGSQKTVSTGAEYSLNGTVQMGRDYTYHLTYSHSGDTVCSNVVFYDFLENGADRRTDSGTVEFKQSDWHGNLKSVDVSLIQSLHTSGEEEIYCAPRIYYSTAEFDRKIADDDPAYDLSNTEVWTEVTDDFSSGVWTAPQPAEGRITAIAIDCSKDSAGNPYRMPSLKALELYLTMQAPLLPGMDKSVAYNDGVLSCFRESEGSLTNTKGHMNCELTLADVIPRIGKTSFPEGGTGKETAGLVHKGGRIEYTLAVSNPSDRFSLSNITFGDTIDSSLNILEDEILVHSGNAADAVNIQESPRVTMTREEDSQRLDFTLNFLNAEETIYVVIPVTVKKETENLAYISNQADMRDPNVEDRTYTTDTVWHQVVPVDLGIRKTDIDGKPLPDAGLELRTAGDAEDRTLIRAWTSKETPEMFELDPGVYILHETAAPTNYLNAADITITVNPDGIVLADGVPVEPELNGEKEIAVVGMADPYTGSARLEIMKALSDPKVGIGKGEFSFSAQLVAQKTGTDPEAEESYAPIEDGKVYSGSTTGSSGKVSFEAIPYTQEDVEKTYIYKIWETKGDKLGIEYSEEVLYAEVAVGEAEYGVLHPTVTYFRVEDGKRVDYTSKEKPTITNTCLYGKLSVTKHVKTAAGSERPADETYTLKLTYAGEPALTSEQWHNIYTANKMIPGIRGADQWTALTFKIKADETITLEQLYGGTYRVEEIGADGDVESYYAEVVRSGVEDPETVLPDEEGSTGREIAVKPNETSRMEITNSYTRRATLALSGTKEVLGTGDSESEEDAGASGSDAAKPEEGAYSFELSADEGNPMGAVLPEDTVVTNDGEGRFGFSEITFRNFSNFLEGETERTYTFYVKERRGEDSSIAYDEDVYTVKVTVSYDKETMKYAVDQVVISGTSKDCSATYTKKDEGPSVTSGKAGEIDPAKAECALPKKSVLSVDAAAEETTENDEPLASFLNCVKGELTVDLKVLGDTAPQDGAYRITVTNPALSSAKWEEIAASNPMFFGKEAAAVALDMPSKDDGTEGPDGEEETSGLKLLGEAGSYTGLEFSLKHQEKIVLTELPPGNYTVMEETHPETDRFVAYYETDGVQVVSGADKAVAAVASGSERQVSVIDVYPDETQIEVPVTKQITSADSPATDLALDKTFAFTLTYLSGEDGIKAYSRAGDGTDPTEGGGSGSGPTADEEFSSGLTEITGAGDSLFERIIFKDAGTYVFSLTENALAVDDLTEEMLSENGLTTDALSGGKGSAGVQSEENTINGYVKDRSEYRVEIEVVQKDSSDRYVHALEIKSATWQKVKDCEGNEIDPSAGGADPTAVTGQFAPGPDKENPAFTNVYQTLGTSTGIGVQKIVSAVDDVPVPTQEFRFALSFRAQTSEPGQKVWTDPDYEHEFTSDTFALTVGGETLSAASDPKTLYFDKAGTYSFTVSEIQPSPTFPGWQTDTARYTVQVKVEDQNGVLKVTQRTWTRTPEAGEGTAGPGEPAEGEAMVLPFANTYGVTSADYTLSVNKTVASAEDTITPPAAEFTFTLEAFGENDAAGYVFVPLTGEGEDGEGNASRTVSVTGEGEESFPTLRFTKPGTYYFRLMENQPANPGYTKDPAVYAVRMEVTDVSSYLRVEAEYKDVSKAAGDAADPKKDNGYEPISGSLPFGNIYQTTSVTVPVSKRVSGIDPSLAVGRTFAFGLYTADGSFNITDTEPLRTLEITIGSDGTGEGEMDPLVYSEDEALPGRAGGTGTFHYVVKETSGDKDGYTADSAQYPIAVEIGKDTAGALTQAVKIGESGPDGELHLKDMSDAVEFENVYHATGTAALTAVKHVTGGRSANISAGEFTFRAVLVSPEELPEGSAVRSSYDGRVDNGSATNADVTFDTVSLNEKDAGMTYIFALTEDTPAPSYIKKAEEKTYYAKLVVTTDGSGGMTANVTYHSAYPCTRANEIESSKVIFTNRYFASGQVQFTAQKSLTGSPLAAGQFSFVLKNASGEVLQTKTNAADGSISFDPISYTQANIGQRNVYMIEEVYGAADGEGQTGIASRLDGVSYDSTTYVIAVDIADGGNGVLQVTDTVLAPLRDDGGENAEGGTDASAGILFENRFAGSVTLRKTGIREKALEGAKFRLYARAVDGGEEWTVYTTEAAADGVYTTGEDGTLSVTELPANDYYFVETEAPDGYLIEKENGSPKRYPFTIGIGNAADEGSGACVSAELNVANPPDREDPPEDYYREAHLTVTKRLMNTDRTEKTSDEIFYAGIFADEQYTTLSDMVSENIVELALGGKSEVDQDVTVKIAPDEETTLYVTEVNADGSPVESGSQTDGEDFGYEVTVENPVVTLNENDTAEIVITNRELKIIPGSDERCEATVEAVKTLSGAALTAGMFTFELRDADGALVQAVQNDAEGKVLFDPLVYTPEDIGETYTYTLTEKDTDISGIRYDDAVYRITVEVQDNGDGTISAVRTVTDADGKAVEGVPAFANVFAGSATLHKTGPDGQALRGVEFQLYAHTAAGGDDWKVCTLSSADGSYTTGADGTLTATGLPANDYYFIETKALPGFVKETDAAGEPMKYSFTIAPTETGSRIQLSVVNIPKRTDKKIIVTKKLLHDDQWWAASHAIFYVALFSDIQLTHRVSEIRTIEFRDQSEVSVEFSGLNTGETYYVAEVDSNGTALNRTGGVTKDGSLYRVNFVNGNAVILLEDDSTKTVDLWNEFETLPSQYYRPTELSVTKKLLDAAGAEKSGDEVFYAGIFKDAEHTTLSDAVTENIVELSLGGSSSVTKSIVIALGKQETLTLYVAEVDKTGKPVEASPSFGYDVTMEDAVVKLEPGDKAAVTITNQETEDKGENPGEPDKDTAKDDDRSDSGNDSDSGGDSGVSGQSVKTGDETPLVFYVSLMTATLLFMVLMLRRRRKGNK